MPTTRCHRQTWFFSALAVSLLLGSGCCGPMACGPVGGHGPIAFGGAAACGDGCNGCGERYVDEWVNHPPSCNDPCDGCGNFNGQTCHACRPVFRGFLSLWGYRCDPPPVGCDRVACQPSCGLESCGGGCDAGCDSCGGGHLQESYQPVPLETDGVQFSGPEFGEPDFGEPVRLHAHPEPSHGPSIVRPMPRVNSYQPQRTRQIFRPRGSVASGQSRPSAF